MSAGAPKRATWADDTDSDIDEVRKSSYIRFCLE